MTISPVAAAFLVTNITIDLALAGAASARGHVAVKLPAPIFDRLSLELRAVVRTMVDGQNHRGRDHFEFEGVRYERVHGAYWQVGAHTGGIEPPTS